MAVVEHDGGVISNLWGSFGVDDFTSSPWTVFCKILGLDGGFQMSWNDSQFGSAKFPGWDKAAYRDSFYMKVPPVPIADDQVPCNWPSEVRLPLSVTGPLTTRFGD
jgi:hypothetical protein